MYACLKSYFVIILLYYLYLFIVLLIIDNKKENVTFMYPGFLSCGWLFTFLLLTVIPNLWTFQSYIGV